MTIDSGSLLAKWDSMFLRTVDPTRERRMEAILGVLGPGSHRPIRVLDLGTGPGPLVARILDRFGGSRVVGVDADPVLLEVGRRALRRHGERVSWVLADLREKDWSSGLRMASFDAAVSSLALHWLEEREIRSLYRDLRRILRDGGRVVTGDFLPSERTRKRSRDPGGASGGDYRAQKEDAAVRAFRVQWTRWWSALEREPTMRSAFREREIRLPGAIPPRRTPGPTDPVTVETHQRSLRDAGFGGTAVAWREDGFRVLVATK
ncbi:MAG: class I SAM-dependent methyltransferase [Thermoplasmata archaeon]|nr:class I SAM-dependent methyltransferase [Thermoplasmata archaeon]